MLQDTRVVHKEGKKVNRFDQFLIVIFFGGFEGTEIHAVRKWVKFVTEVPEI